MQTTCLKSCIYICTSIFPIKKPFSAVQLSKPGLLYFGNTRKHVLPENWWQVACCPPDSLLPDPRPRQMPTTPFPRSVAVRGSHVTHPLQGDVSRHAVAHLQTWSIQLTLHPSPGLSPSYELKAATTSSDAGSHKLKKVAALCQPGSQVVSPPLPNPKW